MQQRGTAGASTNDYKGLFLKSLSAGLSCSPDDYTHFGPINYCYCEVPYLKIKFFKLANMSSSSLLLSFSPFRYFSSFLSVKILEMALAEFGYGRYKSSQTQWKMARIFLLLAKVYVWHMLVLQYRVAWLQSRLSGNQTLLFTRFYPSVSKVSILSQFYNLSIIGFC